MNSIAHCQAIIQRQCKPGELPHVTVYDEEIANDPEHAIHRVAEAFTSHNGSANVAEHERNNRVTAKVRYVPGVPSAGDPKDAATSAAFSALVDKLIAKYGDIV